MRCIRIWLSGLLFVVTTVCIGDNTYAVPTMEGTFGQHGESGIWFDPTYDTLSPLAQTSSPGINFAGGGGVNDPLAQVHEFDTAVSINGGAGYFLTEADFSSSIPLTVTPTYTDSSPAQVGMPYVIQHYTVANLTAAAIHDIWLMSYLNIDLYRANDEVPSQRVGLLNDEQVVVSQLDGVLADTLILRQHQSDTTEMYFQGMMYKNNALAGVDRFMVLGPGTVSGGGDAVYDEIYYNGILNFSDAATVYGSGTPINYSTESEYAFAIGFDIGSLESGEIAEIAVAMSTDPGLYAEEYFNVQYPTMFIPEPATAILIGLGIAGLWRRRKQIG